MAVPSYPSQAYAVVGDTNPLTQVWEFSSGSMVANTAAAYKSWVANGGNAIVGQAQITNVQNNGSGAYRLTVSPDNSRFTNNDVWVVQNTGTTADGTWAVTKVGSNQVDLQTSVFGTTATTGVIDRGTFFATKAALNTFIDTTNQAIARPLFASFTPTGDTTLTNPLPTWIDVNTNTLAAHNFILPQANLIGSLPIGAGFTFNNDSLFTQTLKRSDGVTLAGYPGVGTVRYVLTDNSTSHGSWITDATQSINGSFSAPQAAIPVLSNTFANDGNWAAALPGFDTPINLQLNASVASSKLTITVVAANGGGTPNASNPVYIPFRDPTIANGGPVWRAVTSGLSIDTNAVGATLGTANSTAFRLWVVAFDNAGTVVLALWQSTTWGANPATLNALDETNVASTTAISGSATAAGTFYTPNGTTLTSKAFRIIGFVEYASGLTTAGTYASAPTKIQLFGPGVKKPGDIVALKFQAGPASVSTTSNTYTGTNLSISYSPKYAMALVKATLTGYIQSNAPATAIVDSAIFAGGNQVGTAFVQFNAAAGVAGVSQGACALTVWDAPNSTSARTYEQRIKNSDNVTTVLASGTGDTLTVEEYMT